MRDPVMLKNGMCAIVPGRTHTECLCVISDTLRRLPSFRSSRVALCGQTHMYCIEAVRWDGTHLKVLAYPGDLVIAGGEKGVLVWTGPSEEPLYDVPESVRPALRAFRHLERFRESARALRAPSWVLFKNGVCAMDAGPNPRAHAALIERCAAGPGGFSGCRVTPGESSGTVCLRVAAGRGKALAVVIARSQIVFMRAGRDPLLRSFYPFYVDGCSSLTGSGLRLWDGNNPETAAAYAVYRRVGVMQEKIRHGKSCQV